MHRNILPGNPNPNRKILAFHFLRALARISQSRAAHSSPSRRRITLQRSQRIKCAAYTSIALAAGPGRSWSRSILRRLRGRAGVRVLSRRRIALCKKVRTARPKKREGGSQVDELRRLVPGGEGMDLCSLLEETGDYIQCLTAQVGLMQRIADSLSKQV